MLWNRIFMGGFIIFAMLGCDYSGAIESSEAGGIAGATSCEPSSERGATADGDAVHFLDPGCEVYSGEECGLVFASSDPEIGFADNYTWTLEVEGSCTRVIAKATMPDHGHGTLPAEVEGVVSDNMVELTPLNLYMGGIWKIEFTLFIEETLLGTTSVFIVVEG